MCLAEDFQAIRAAAGDPGTVESSVFNEDDSQEQ